MANASGKDYLIEIYPKLTSQKASYFKLQIHIPGFLLQKNYLFFSIHLHIIDSYLVYEQLFNKMIQLAPGQIWHQEIKNMKNNFMNSYLLFYEKLGEKGRALTKALKEEIEQELQNLPQLITTDDEDHHVPESIEQLITKLKDDVKKGNRVTFKLLQELQHSLEQTQLDADSELEEVVEDVKENAKKQMRELVQLLLEVFDLLDLVRSNALQKEDDVWINEINHVVDKALMLLTDYGIEEIPVLGQPFDGKTMEGIGTVSQDDAEGLDKYDVYSVFQRGFRFTHNGKLIRRAKVITVY